jgi:hypothetical protein
MSVAIFRHKTLCSPYERTCSSETSVHIWTTERYITQDNTMQDYTFVGHGYIIINTALKYKVQFLITWSSVV